MGVATHIRNGSVTTTESFNPFDVDPTDICTGLADCSLQEEYLRKPCEVNGSIANGEPKKERYRHHWWSHLFDAPSKYVEAIDQQR